MVFFKKSKNEIAAREAAINARKITRNLLNSKGLYKQSLPMPSAASNVLENNGIAVACGNISEVVAAYIKTHPGVSVAVGCASHPTEFALGLIEEAGMEGALLRRSDLLTRTLVQWYDSLDDKPEYPYTWHSFYQMMQEAAKPIKPNLTKDRYDFWMLRFNTNKDDWPYELSDKGQLICDVRFLIDPSGDYSDADNIALIDAISVPEIGERGMGLLDRVKSELALANESDKQVIFLPMLGENILSTEEIVLAHKQALAESAASIANKTIVFVSPNMILAKEMRESLDDAVISQDFYQQEEADLQKAKYLVALVKQAHIAYSIQNVLSSDANTGGCSVISSRHNIDKGIADGRKLEAVLDLILEKYIENNHYQFNPGVSNAIWQHLKAHLQSRYDGGYANTESHCSRKVYILEKIKDCELEYGVQVNKTFRNQLFADFESKDENKVCINSFKP